MNQENFLYFNDREVTGRNSIFSFQLYELIKSKVNADTAAKAAQSVEGIIEIKIMQLATKEDIAPVGCCHQQAFIVPVW